MRVFVPISFCCAILISCSSTQEQQAKQQFCEYIAVVDSCYKALDQVWELIDLPDNELKSKMQEWAPLVSKMDEHAQKASEVIAPYDAQLSEDANICHGYANEALYYANMYLQGHLGYSLKFETWLGHAGTALQDVKNGMKQIKNNSKRSRLFHNPV